MIGQLSQRGGKKERRRVFIGMICKLAAYDYTLWTMLEYELVDANGVCQGIQKVRVEPATRSAVATCNVITLLVGEKLFHVM